MEHSQWNIEWDDRLAFGIPELDAEHRELACLSNDLNGSIDRGASAKELNALMEIILDQAQVHFRHEEEMLTEAEYPLRKGHHLLHEQLRNELQQVRARATGQISIVLWREYGLLVRQLLEEHFVAEATRYKKFFA